MMVNRKRLLQVGWVLLYLGSVMIGMAAEGFGGFAAILGIMLLYTVLMRPVEQWAGPGLQGLTRFALVVGVLAVLSGVLWLAGLGLSWLTGALSVWVGIGAALAGVVLARIVWSPEKEAELNAVLEDAVSRINAAAEGRPLPASEHDAAFDLRDEVLGTLVKEGAPTLAEAQALAARLGPVLDRGLYREVLIDLGDIEGTAALRFRVALMARPEVTPDWDDAKGAMIALQQALDIDDETAALALDVVDYWLSEPDADLVEASLLRDPLSERLAALPDAHPLRARLEAVVAELEAVAGALGGENADADTRAAQDSVAQIVPGTGDDEALARLEGIPPRGAMAAVLALDARAREGDAWATRVLVLHATRPAVASWLGGLYVPRTAFDRTAGDAALTMLFAERALAMIDKHPGLVAELPDVGTLRDRATALPEAAAALERLAAWIEGGGTDD